MLFMCLCVVATSSFLVLSVLCAMCDGHIVIFSVGHVGDTCYHVGVAA